MDVKRLIENRRFTFKNYTGKELSNKAFIEAIESALKKKAMEDLETYILRDIGAHHCQEALKILRSEIEQPEVKSDSESGSLAPAPRRGRPPKNAE